MLKKNTAVVGVIHPQVHKFLPCYLKSLSNQTFKDFDLILFDDRLKDKKIFSKFTNLNVEINAVNGSPSENRNSIIKYIKNSNYDFIIFTDCDDSFSKNRLEISLKKLEKSKIVLNDLNLVNKNKKTKMNYFSKRIANDSVFSIEDLYHFNLLGFTNTSLRRGVLENIPPLKNNLEIFDWYFWTNLLLRGETAVFTNETTTNYRIHSENTTGLPQPLNRKLIMNAIKVKKDHYHAFSHYNDTFKKLYETFNYIHIMSKNKSWQDEYIHFLKKHKSHNPFWWENIRPHES